MGKSIGEIMQELTHGKPKNNGKSKSIGQIMAELSKPNSKTCPYCGAK